MKKFNKSKFLSDEEEMQNSEYKEDVLHNTNNNIQSEKDKVKGVSETIYSNDKSFSSCPEEQEG